MEMRELTLEKFEEASEIVGKVTQETKLIYSEYFSEKYGTIRISIKPENMQRTGAYKVRGAYYKIQCLSPEEREKGLITASAGNHAQGVAYAAKLSGVKATVVMPVATPLIKVNRTRALGADVVLYGDVFDEACAHAYELADEHGYTFVIPLTIWRSPPARAASRWRSLKSCRRWIISWFLWEAADSAPAFPLWPAFEPEN